MSHAQGNYYLPSPSHWPLVGSIGLFLTVGGFAMALVNKTDAGLGNMTVMYVGLAVLVVMLFGWFGTVIKESQAGLYNAQVDVTFRMGMMWFIFSEVMFFAAFFGALFYVRQLAVPWLGGAGNNAATNEFLWPGFEAVWPMLNNPDTSAFAPAKETIGAWGVPLYNTLILLSSGVTVTFAHWGLKKGNQMQLILGLLATVILGFVFVYFQAVEYGHAYNELDLTLDSGIYGSTFFMLTGFHGMHVSIGAIMLTVMLVRSIKGHFSEEHHFAFEAAAWYWHFVDVVWLGLFIFVYWV